MGIENTTQFSRFSATIYTNSDGEKVLQLTNDGVSTYKIFMNIEQLLRELRRWWTIGVEWEPVGKTTILVASSKEKV